jgi:predicted amidohydrolase YtcJ
MSRTRFFNGKIWDGIAGSTLATSLTVANGRVVALDSADSADLEIDLHGRFMMPAFADGHAHPLFGGREAQGPAVTGLPSIEATLEAVRVYAEANPGDEWIVGGAYNATLEAKGNFDARWLDAVVSDRPVLLHAMDHHTVWVNSKALEITEIAKFTDDPPLGTIERREDGSPLGTLREWGAVALVTKHVPARPMNLEIAAIEYAATRYAGSGVTWVQDAWIDRGMCEAYLEAEKSGKLSIGFNLGFRADPSTWRIDLPYFVAQRDVVDSLPEPTNLTARTAKFFADGVIEGGTAAMLDEYTDHPGYHGMPVWERGALIEAVLAFDAAGFQIFVHAIGDAGIRNSLDAIEEAVLRNPPRDRRPVITHIQLLDPLDLPRFRKLGVIANFEPLWTCLDPMQVVLSVPRLGTERTARQYQMRSLLDDKVVLSFGSDWPVTSEVPLEGLAVAVHRQTPDRQPPDGWIPEERITMEEALMAYTSGVAFQSFEENSWGRLIPGLEANLIILDEDPRRLEPHDASRLAVAKTYRRGIKIFDKDSI